MKWAWPISICYVHYKGLVFSSLTCHTEKIIKDIAFILLLVNNVHLTYLATVKVINYCPGGRNVHKYSNKTVMKILFQADIVSFSMNMITFQQTHSSMSDTYFVMLVIRMAWSITVWHIAFNSQ